jgi:hypothetical protein
MRRQYEFARKWWLSARFPIGIGNFVAVDQVALPTGLIPLTGNGTRDFCLGVELGQAFLKLLRPWPVSPHHQYEPIVGPDYSNTLLKRLPSSSEAEMLRLGFLFPTETILDLSLQAPALLPTIGMRVDLLTDEVIRRRIAYLLPAMPSPVIELPNVFDVAFTAKGLILASGEGNDQSD